MLIGVAVSGPIYIGELAPSHIRGKIMSFWQLFYSVGSFICFWVAYACSEHIAALGEWDWKMTVIFQILVPLIVLTLLPFMPGTPRWYLKKNGDIEKARNALRRVRDTDEEVEAELMEIREALEFEKEISSSYSALWKDPSVRKRLMIAFVLNAGQQITGQGSLNSYSTKIYQKVFQDPQKIMLINALNATCGIIFTLNAVWTVDRFGRKFLLIVGGIGMGLCMIVCASVETQTPTLEGGAKSQPVSIAIVFLLFLFIFFCEYTRSCRLVQHANIVFRQTILGSHHLDLDLGNLLHQRAGTGGGYVCADAERGQLHCQPVFPHLPQEVWLLRVLYVRRDQLFARLVCLFRRARNQASQAGRDGHTLRWPEPH